MKSITRLLQVATLAALVVVGAAAPAAAQAVDSASFGYQFVRFTGDAGTNVPAGVFGDVSGKLSPTMPALTWLGEVTYGHKSDTETIAGVSANATENLLTVGGGVRYAITTTSATLKPHVQGVLFLAHASSSTDATIGGVSQSTSGSDNNLGLEVSAGLDYPLSNGWAATGAVGFERIFSSSGQNALVVRVGVTKKIGS